MHSVQCHHAVSMPSGAEVLKSACDQFPLSISNLGRYCSGNPGQENEQWLAVCWLTDCHALEL